MCLKIKAIWNLLLELYVSLENEAIHRDGNGGDKINLTKKTKDCLSAMSLLSGIFILTAG